MEVAKAKKLVVQVGHIEHFNPVMKFMEERVRSPRFITADRLAPFNPRGTEVGVVLDLMIHDIGVVLKLANSHVSRIEAVGVGVLSRSEDIANARIAFENGCVANLNVSRVSLKNCATYAFSKRACTCRSTSSTRRGMSYASRTARKSSPRRFR